MGDPSVPCENSFFFPAGPGHAQPLLAVFDKDPPIEMVAWDLLMDRRQCQGEDPVRGTISFHIGYAVLSEK